MRHLWKHWLLVIFFAALIPRVGFVAWRWPTSASILTPLNDSTDYDHLARSLLEGKGYSAPCGKPTAFRPPLYPTFLAVVYSIFGVSNLGAVALIQAVLGALQAVLIALIARAAGFRDRTAIVAGLIAALYPAFAFQTPEILTEVLHRFLQAGTVLLLLASVEKRSLSLLAAAGGGFGLAVLNKSVLLAAAPFVIIWMLVHFWKGYPTRPDFRGTVSRVGRPLTVFVLPMAVLVGGWTVRNAAVSGEFIPVSSNFPITFAFGVTSHSYYTRLWYGPKRCMDSPANLLELTQLRYYCGVTEELAVGRPLAARARRFIADHLSWYAVLTVRKALHFWGASIRNTGTNEWIAFLTMGPVLAGGWLAVVLLFWRRHPAAAFVTLALALALPITVPYAISQPDVRYRLSLIDPLWIILAAGLLEFFPFRADEFKRAAIPSTPPEPKSDRSK